MFISKLPTVTSVPPPLPVLPPSLAVIVTVAAPTPFTLGAALYVIFEFMLMYDSIAEAVPVIVICDMALPVSVTGIPPGFAREIVPELSEIVRTTSPLPESTSEKVAEEKAF